jgi:hypothetical protein
MIIMMFFLLSIAVLGIVVYKYLQHEQDKFIPKDKYDEAWNEFFKNSPPKKVAFTRKNNVIGYIFRKISGNVLVSIFLGFILTIVFIFVCVYVTGYVILGSIFSGGITGFINNLKPEPNPNSWAMNAKREAATEEVNQYFDELQNILHYNYYNTATTDDCSKGHSSWKTGASLAYVCSLGIVKFYGFDGDFRQQMIDFEKKISSIGWKPPYSPFNPMEKMLVEYYDHPETNYSGDPVVSNLPISDLYYEYEKDKKGFLYLEVGFVEKESRDISRLDDMQGIGFRDSDSFYEKTNFIDSRTVFNKITNINRFVLVIRIIKSYYLD